MEEGRGGQRVKERESLAACFGCRRSVNFCNEFVRPHWGGREGERAREDRTWGREECVPAKRLDKYFAGVCVVPDTIRRGDWGGCQAAFHITEIENQQPTRLTRLEAAKRAENKSEM